MKTPEEINNRIDDLCQKIWETRVHGGFKGNRYAQLDILYWVTGMEPMTVREVEKRGGDIYIAKKKAAKVN